MTTDVKTEVSSALLARLEGAVGKENVLSDAASLQSHSANGASPAAVVFPNSTEELSAVLRAAWEDGVMVTPWGAGTKQNWGPVHPGGGLIVSLKHMNALTDLVTEDLMAIVQPGLTAPKLAAEATPARLFFPLDPDDMDTATLGGTVSANTSGSLRLLYRTARDLLLGGQVVLANGDVMKIGGKTVKNVAGYDVRKLFIGAWGTLGIISEMNLRLWPIPEDDGALLLKTANLDGVARLALKLNASRLVPAAFDLLDAKAASGIKAAAGFNVAGGDNLLMLRFQGAREAVDRQIVDVEKMARAEGASDALALRGDEAAAAWKGRRAFGKAVKGASLRGKSAVPISKAVAMFQSCQVAAASQKLDAATVALLGSGLAYAQIGLPADAEKAADKGEMLAATLAKRAENLGGFFAVEGAPAAVRKEINHWPGRDDYQAMLTVKGSLDARGILNPYRVPGENI